MTESQALAAAQTTVLDLIGNPTNIDELKKSPLYNVNYTKSGRITQRVVNGIRGFLEENINIDWSKPWTGEGDNALNTDFLNDLSEEDHRSINLHATGQTIETPEIVEKLYQEYVQKQGWFGERLNSKEFAQRLSEGLGNKKPYVLSEKEKLINQGLEFIKQNSPETYKQIHNCTVNKSQGAAVQLLCEYKKFKTSIGEEVDQGSVTFNIDDLLFPTLKQSK